MKRYIHAGSAGFIINFISVSVISVLGFGLFAPLVSAMALIPPIKTTCCSNVAFIPGLEGSRLYTAGVLSENQLWEPNRNADVEKLYMDTNGKSLDPSVYTKDIINATNYGLYDIDIYQSFSKSMDDLVSGSIINQWKALPYDWRQDYKDIMVNGVQSSDMSTSSLVNQIETLAANSRTGKVTLVAHSNGGLLAKRLISELDKEGKSNLIDNFIMIAVPQLGTPESIPAILHGYGQVLLDGILLNGSVARTLAKNMPTAYNLLPSTKYITQNDGPLITFDPSIDPISNLRKVYGDTISDQATLDNFLLGLSDGRLVSTSSDDWTPSVLNYDLLSSAQKVHQDLDNWLAPSNIAVSQIVGWGLDTVKGVVYKDKNVMVCSNVCVSKDVLDAQPVFDFHGDGIVMHQSAEAMSVPTYYVNLAGINSEQNTNRAHGDMLETNAIQELVKNIVTGQMSSLPENVTTTLPQINGLNRLDISVHSPVSLDLYDNLGNHTGPVADKDPNSDLDRYETKVPNSYYLPFGEGVYAGVNNSATTTISLHGTGVGSFTLQVNGSTFEDLPVLPTTVATIQASAATTSALTIDLNGDGKTDISVAPGQNFDPIKYLQGMESVVSTFGLSKKVESRLDQKIENLITLIKKGKINRVEKKIQIYLKSAKLTKKHRKITADDQDTIITMLNNMLDNLN